MVKKYLLGSDIGSSSCKTLLADTEGHVIARATAPYPLHHPHPDWSEYDPDDWYTAFRDCVHQVLRSSQINAADILAICIVGITHNPVLLDANDVVLRPSIHFNDRRSLPQCEALVHKWGDTILQQATNAMGPLWTYPQLLWVKQHEPGVWARVARIIFPKDYVRERITAPNRKNVTDWIEATGTLFFDPEARQWIDTFLADLDLTPDHFSQMNAPVDVAGTVSARASADTGLHRGTTVLVGTTDTAAEMLAAGAHSPGKGTVKLASVGRIAVITDHAVRNERILNYPFFESLWYPGTATKYAAAAYRWLHESLWRDIYPNDYATMDAAAEATPLGADGLIFLPHLMGQFAPYWNPNLSGAFLGVNLAHQIGHFTRAVLEGVALNIREAFEECNTIGLDADEILLIGNGARSNLWSQIITDVLRRPLKIPKERDAAFGAVLLAGMQAGTLPDALNALHPYVPIERICNPRNEVSDRYDSLYTVYREANVAISEVSEKLTAFRS